MTRSSCASLLRQSSHKWFPYASVVILVAPLEAFLGS